MLLIILKQTTRKSLLNFVVRQTSEKLNYLAYQDLLEKSQNVTYTKPYQQVQEENVKRDAKEKARQHIQSGAVSKSVNTGNQNKHIHGHKDNTGTKSPIYGDLNTAERLINQYSGTGDPLLKRNNEWNNKERIVTDHNIGIHIDKDTGTKTPTNCFIIHYGNSGAHIVPARPSKRGE